MYNNDKPSMIVELEDVDSFNRLNEEEEEEDEEDY